MEHCNGIMHTVKSGDTLYSISMEHKVPLALVLRANPYVDVYNLQVGETICVPVRGNMQGGMPPYSGSCGKWEVRDAVPMTKEDTEQEASEENMVKMKNERMQPVEEPVETEQEHSGQQEETDVEGTTLQENSAERETYVTREGDSLEKILGVEKILLQPGMTIYRQK